MWKAYLRDDGEQFAPLDGLGAAVDDEDRQAQDRDVGSLVRIHGRGMGCSHKQSIKLKINTLLYIPVCGS